MSPSSRTSNRRRRWRTLGCTPQFPKLSDPIVAVTVGDTLTCFWGAIDHLAWLTVKRQGTHLGQLKRGELRGIAFPLAQNWTRFPEAFKRRLPGVPLDSDIGRLVKAYQACGRGNRATAMRALRNLGDRDKHRLLIPTFWFPEGIKFEVIPRGVAVTKMRLLIDTSRRVPLESNKPLVRVSITPTSLIQSHLELNANATFQPALGGSWWMMPTLEGIRNEVEGLLKAAALSL